VSKRAAEIRNDFKTDDSFDYLFGECPLSLRDSVSCLFEAKKDISLKSAIGEIFPKLQNLYHKTFILDYHCILFDPQQLYLLKFSGNGLRSYHHLNWTTPDARRFVVEFLSSQARRPLWLQSFLKSTEHFNVQPLLNGYLGSGATGRVFKVESKDGEFWALKVVDEHIDSLRAECNIMGRLQSIGFPPSIKKSLPFLSPQCQNPYYMGDVDHPTVGSILLGPVGESIMLEDRSFDLFSCLLGSLIELHRHLIRHGDPRMPNIIRISPPLSSPSSFVWIDLRESEVEFSVHGRFIVDFRLFIRSFFNRPREENYNQLEAKYDGLRERIKLNQNQITLSNPLSDESKKAVCEFELEVWNHFHHTDNRSVKDGLTLFTLHP
jgi:hypothetical protein